MSSLNFETMTYDDGLSLVVQRYALTKAAASPIGSIRISAALSAIEKRAAPSMDEIKASLSEFFSRPDVIAPLAGAGVGALGGAAAQLLKEKKRRRYGEGMLTGGVIGGLAGGLGHYGYKALQEEAGPNEADLLKKKTDAEKVVADRKKTKGEHFMAGNLPQSVPTAIKLVTRKAVGTDVDPDDPALDFKTINDKPENRINPEGWDLGAEGTDVTGTDTEGTSHDESLPGAAGVTNQVVNAVTGAGSDALDATTGAVAPVVNTFTDWMSKKLNAGAQEVSQWPQALRNVDPIHVGVGTGVAATAQANRIANKWRIEKSVQTQVPGEGQDSLRQATQRVVDQYKRKPTWNPINKALRVYDKLTLKAEQKATSPLTGKLRPSRANLSSDPAHAAALAVYDAAMEKLPGQEAAHKTKLDLHNTNSTALRNKGMSLADSVSTASTHVAETEAASKKSGLSTAAKATADDTWREAKVKLAKLMAEQKAHGVTVKAHEGALPTPPTKPSAPTSSRAFTSRKTVAGHARKARGSFARGKLFRGGLGALSGFGGAALQALWHANAAANEQNTRDDAAADNAAADAANDYETNFGIRESNLTP
jgi:hypothetical protein